MGTAKRAEQRRGGFDPCARSLQRETITVEMADKTKGAATNMEVTFANLQHGKRLKGKTRSRLHILVGLLFLGAVAGVAALIAKKGLPDIDPVKVHTAIDDAGYLGIVVYIVGFGLAEVLCWGHLRGWIMALIMAPLSCSVSFLVVRRIGGQALANVEWAWVQRLMSKLDEFPVKTVVVLRLIFFMAPAVNYMLALSSVNFKNFLVGTWIGLAVPLTVAVFFIDHLITYMGWSKAQHLEIGHALQHPPPAVAEGLFS